MDYLSSGRQEGTGASQCFLQPREWPAVSGRDLAGVHLRPHVPQSRLSPSHLASVGLCKAGADPPPWGMWVPLPGLLRPSAYLLPRSQGPSCLHPSSARILFQSHLKAMSFRARPSPPCKSPGARICLEQVFFCLFVFWTCFIFDHSINVVYYTHLSTPGIKYLNPVVLISVSLSSSLGAGDNT